MASLYKDSESPFWYLKFKDSAGKWRCKSLRPLRHGIPGDTRKAKAKADQQSLEEHTRSPHRDSWASWVRPYLEGRYLNADTRRRALNAWGRLSEYFTARQIGSPQELQYRDCIEYMPHRTKDAEHNTARLELKILSVICDEAIRRGMIAKNPASKLGIPRVRGKERPELSDDDISKIRLALKAEPDWMSHAFEIALHQGCRLSETPVFADDIDPSLSLIHFRRTKGDKPFTVPLHPSLKPLLQKLLVGAKDRIFELPPNAARDFHRFFQKLAISEVTFHSTRVTVASRLARSGYSISKAMRLLNHGSELVHRQYQRLQAEDVADAYEVLRIPSPVPTAPDPSQSRGRKSGSRSSGTRGAQKASVKRH